MFKSSARLYSSLEQSGEWKVLTNQKIMSKFSLILLVVWMLQASRACEDDNEEELLVRQQSDEYFAKAYGFTADTWNALYNKPSPRLPGKRKRQAWNNNNNTNFNHLKLDYANTYEGRTPLNKLRPSKNPFKNYFNRGESDLKICSMSRWNQF